MRDNENMTSKGKAEELVFKIYVGVYLYHDEDGEIIPKAIIWKKDKIIWIDKASKPLPRASMKAGGSGYRYEIWIQGRRRYLYHEIDEGERWFVENKEIYMPEYEGTYEEKYGFFPDEGDLDSFSEAGC